MVTELNSPADESGAYTPDGLTLVMGSTRGADGMLDVYIATRSIPTGTWSQPAPITELNQNTFGDSHPIISPDLKTIYFQSNRNGTVDLFTAHRAAAVGMFDSPVPIAEIDDPQAVDGDPWVSPDGHHMFFSHTVNGVSAIYETKR
jgi:Tol biopolymer transport system component